MIFTNGKVILPEEIRDDLDVIVEDGVIRGLPPRSERTDAIDLNGKFLAPGFVDLHLHGAVGRDTMEATAQGFAAICDFHLSGGTTSLLLTTVTAPLAEITRALDAVGSFRKARPQVAGVHVEGPFLSRQKAGAQKAEHFLQPTNENVACLLEHAEVIKRVTLAPEIDGALRATEKFVDAGITVSGGHSNAWEEDARAAFTRGMRSVTHTFNCMSTMRRREQERVAGLLEFALSEPQINCELIADGLHVSPTLMRMLYRAKGAAGISLVTDATAGAGLAEGAIYRLGGFDCVVGNGAGWLADRSALAGSGARMIDLVRTMVTKVGVSLPEAVAMASSTPARTIGLEKKGEIKVGNDADLVVLTKNLEVADTYLAGERGV